MASWWDTCSSCSFPAEPVGFGGRQFLLTQNTPLEAGGEHHRSFSQVFGATASSRFPRALFPSAETCKSPIRLTKHSQNIRSPLVNLPEKGKTSLMRGSGCFLCHRHPGGRVLSLRHHRNRGLHGTCLK